MRDSLDHRIDSEVDQLRTTIDQIDDDQFAVCDSLDKRILATDEFAKSLVAHYVEHIHDLGPGKETTQKPIYSTLKMIKNDKMRSRGYYY